MVLRTADSEPRPQEAICPSFSALPDYPFRHRFRNGAANAGVYVLSELVGKLLRSLPRCCSSWERRVRRRQVTFSLNSVPRAALPSTTSVSGSSWNSRSPLLSPGNTASCTLRKPVMAETHRGTRTVRTFGAAFCQQHRTSWNQFGSPVERLPGYGCRFSRFPRRLQLYEWLRRRIGSRESEQPRQMMF